jgi:outer membrane protein assembly factor BamB
MLNAHCGSSQRLCFSRGFGAAAILGVIPLFWFSAAPAFSASHDWPRWRGPELNGISKETGWTSAWPKEGPRQLWKAEVGVGFSSVAVSRGRAYTLGNQKQEGQEADTVYCFEAETGSVIWQHTYACPLDAQHYEGGPGSTPTVEGDRVYTFSKRGHLFCFEAASGKVVWQRNLMDELRLHKPRWGFAGSPLILDRLLLLNAGQSGMALEKISGKLVWGSGTNIGGYATPVPFQAGREQAVMVFGERALYAVRVGDGQELWTYPWKTQWDVNAVDPIVAGNTVFISSYERAGARLQFAANTPKLLWENRQMGNQFAACVLWGGYLYGTDGNTDRPGIEFRCLDLKTGSVQWSHPGLGLAQGMVADGKLIILSDKGELVVAPASPRGFKPLARAQVLGGKCWTVPVLANGRIYCRNAKGTLVCLDVRPPGAKE